MCVSLCLRDPRLAIRSGFQLRLNYCISLCNCGRVVEAIEQYHEFVRSLEAAAKEDGDDDLLTDPDIIIRRDALAKSLNIV